MSTFKTITSTDEVRKLAAAGLLWWDKCSLAEVVWSQQLEILHPVGGLRDALQDSK